MSTKLSGKEQKLKHRRDFAAVEEEGYGAFVLLFTRAHLDLLLLCTPAQLCPSGHSIAHVGAKVIRQW